ncbi:hypothetical protein BDR07DRAFT_1400699 [Suillus spraguei]|nr:hypothetical protein BDR07DRAFT_1400699 [Suillus spraguei]
MRSHEIIPFVPLPVAVFYSTILVPSGYRHHIFFQIQPNTGRSLFPCRLRPYPIHFSSCGILMILSLPVVVAGRYGVYICNQETQHLEYTIGFSIRG